MSRIFNPALILVLLCGAAFGLATVVQPRAQTWDKRGNSANVLTGSEESPPGEGYIYNTFLASLVANPNMTAADLGTQIVNTTLAGYGQDTDITQSVLDLTKVGDLATKLDQFGSKLQAHVGDSRQGLIDARNNAESLAYQIEKSLNENREKLDSSVAGTVEGRIMELRGVLESSDVADIKAKTDALQSAWTEAAQALYAQASAEQAQPNGSSTTSDDEVVEDAEYEVVDE